MAKSSRQVDAANTVTRRMKKRQLVLILLVSPACDKGASTPAVDAHPAVDSMVIGDARPPVDARPDAAPDAYVDSVRNTRTLTPTCGVGTILRCDAQRD